MNANKALGALELSLVSQGYQDNIKKWEEYYKGFVADFHSYKEYNGNEDVTRERQSLQMAKKVSEDWADVLYNPETHITVDESYQDRLDEILRKNDFASRVNYSLEKGYALGTLGIETTKIDGEPTIQFISADMMFPVNAEDGRFAWAIVSQPTTDVFYVSLHFEEDNNKHEVHNHVLLKKDDEYVVLSDELVESTYNVEPVTTHDLPMLHIIKPAIANNIDFYTPYGMSIFGNALSTLKSVDIAYSSLVTELETGKMRIFSMVQNLENVHGKATIPNSEGFYVMEGEQTFSDGTTMKTHSPTLRSNMIIDTLETNLNLLGRQVGFGDDAYTFQEGSIYTNTAQVVSTNSKFFKTRQKHLVVIEEALSAMVRSLYYLDKDQEYTKEISVEFDDSIIHDKEQEDRELDFQLMNNLISEVYYWQQKLGLDEDHAIQFVKRQQELRGLKEEPEEESALE